jgi:predicted O-linked N-acetylglucosamine transferase (SPINDLY family)
MDGEETTAGGTDAALEQLKAAQAALEAGDLDRADAQALAVEGEPRHLAAALNIRGVVARRRGNRDAALALFREAGETDRDTAGYFVNQGRTLIEMNRAKEAILPLRRAVALRPHSGEANHNLGNALRLAGDIGGALRHYQLAATAEPVPVQALADLGNLLIRLEEIEAAEPWLAAALEREPDNVDALDGMGAVELRQGHAIAAERRHRRALELKPGSRVSRVNLAMALRYQGRHGEAADLYRELLAGLPPDDPAWSNYLFCLTFDADVTPEALYEAHRDWGRAMEAQAGPEQTFEEYEPREGRKLRIGYLSGDFRAHPVAHFILPVLAGHNREQVHVTCYANQTSNDDTTKRIRRRADEWRFVHSLDDDALAAQIRADRIDILIELSGHTAGNRLAAMARRLAPVQMSYIGYAATTGLSRIDYRITDAATDPEGMERFYTEKLLRIPGGCLAYLPPKETPPVDTDKRSRGRPFTYGSFNNLGKVTDQCLEAWMEILRRAPDTRLVLKAPQLADPEMRDRLMARFIAAGIDASRIDLLGHTKTQYEHFDLYNRIDLALDTFPYNGGTTTFEALHMGVPVVTYAEPGRPFRMGAGILEYAGCGEASFDGIEAMVVRCVDGSAVALPPEPTGVRRRIAAIEDALSIAE